MADSGHCIILGFDSTFWGVHNIFSAGYNNIKHINVILINIYYPTNNIILRL